MHELLTVIENGEIHYSIIKHENGLETLIESFDYNEYSQALKTLLDYNTWIFKACQYGKPLLIGRKHTKHL